MALDSVSAARVAKIFIWHMCQRMVSIRKSIRLNCWLWHLNQFQSSCQPIFQRIWFWLRGAGLCVRAGVIQRQIWNDQIHFAIYCSEPFFCTRRALSHKSRWHYFAQLVQITPKHLAMINQTNKHSANCISTARAHSFAGLSCSPFGFMDPCHSASVGMRMSVWLRSHHNTESNYPNVSRLACIFCFFSEHKVLQKYRCRKHRPASPPSTPLLLLIIPVSIQMRLSV